MAPPVEAFPPWQLEARVQYKADGRMRKPPANIKECSLKEMVQYSCDLQGPRSNPRSVVVCEPIVRLFRKCANGVTVETTTWEGIYDEK